MRRYVRAIVVSALFVLLTAGDGSAEPMQLLVDGRTRTYLLERPAGQGPRPTIIMLHGYTGNAAQIAEQTGLVQPAKQAGFVAAFPDGLGGRWNLLPPSKQTAGYAQLFRQSGGPPDDVAFLKMLVGDLVGRGLADPKRIYLAGRSLGGAMTLRMACVEAPMLAAIALLISAMPEETGNDCHPAQPLPVLMMNVTGDPMVPYGGGRVGQAGLPSGVTDVWSTERLLGFFRKLNGCSDSPEPLASSSQNPASLTNGVQRWVKCPGGPVVFHRVVGENHNVPVSLDPAQLLMNFFRDKSR
jgi:polyhydroxybutyrate depolymerase